MPHSIDEQLPEDQKAMSSGLNKMPEPGTTRYTRRRSSTTFPSAEDLQKMSPDADDELSPELHGYSRDKKVTTRLNPANDCAKDRLRRKRRLSTPELSSSQPHKRVRFSPNPPTQPGPATSNFRRSALDYYCRLLVHLQQQPQALSLTDISGCFRTLQMRTEIFSKEWFGDPDTVGHDVPFHGLKEKHPALFYTIQYILDASTTAGKENQGWRNFFTKPELRSYLVYAILGEWFTQRIFKHTAFGLSNSAQQQISEQVDKAFLHHDAIVRSKCRSELIKQYWRCEDPKDIEDCLSAATFALADELSTVLTPLMTTCTLESFDLFSRDLRGLILDCAGLHLSMLITGRNGTVFMYPGGVTNGTVFHPSHNHFDCVNLSLAGQSRRPASPGEQLLVKMTCWARVEAYVPHGADMNEMAVMEADLTERTIRANERRLGRHLTDKEIAKVENNFDWADTDEGRNFWQPLPRELWADAQARIEKQDMMERSAAVRKAHERNRRMKASNQVGGPSTLSDIDSELDFTDSDNSDEEGVIDEDKVICGPYTTIYHCICPHVVYCEWTSKDLMTNANTSRNKKKGTKTLTLRQTNTLAAAVAQARSELQGYAFHKASFEDLSRKIWDSYARNSLYIEWGVFLIAVLSGLTISLGHKQGFLLDLLKSSASSVALAADTVKDILKTGSNLLVDQAKLSETLERAVRSNERFSEKFVTAFARAFNNISPRNTFADLDLEMFGLERIFGAATPAIAAPESPTPAFPILTREA